MSSAEDFIPEAEPPIIYRCFSCDSEFTELVSEVYWISHYMNGSAERFAVANPDSCSPHMHMTTACSYRQLAYCEDCVTLCRECDNVVSRDDSLEGLDGHDRCADCHYELHSSCESCGDSMWQDDARYSRNGDSGPYCPGCYEDDDESSGYSPLIESYGHTTSDTDPRMRFRNGTLNGWEIVGIHVHRRPEPKFPYIGFELETNIDDVSQRHGAAEFLLGGAPENYMVLKEDGTINGFEIVTYPADYRVHLNLFPWERLPQLAEQFSMRSWNGGTNCGLHVHISKSAFSSSHIYKFMKFHDHNQAQLITLAGRSTSYAQFGTEYWESRKEQALGKQQTPRYVAVNNTPRDTYELRYFRGSLRPDTVKGVIEFTHALWKYTASLTIGDVSRGALDWSRFREFASRHSQLHDYPHLMPLLAARSCP